MITSIRRAVRHATPAAAARLPQLRHAAAGVAIGAAVLAVMAAAGILAALAADWFGLALF